MMTDDQHDVRSFLARPAAIGQPGPVETIETHISFIVLAGTRAFKLKRAVKLPYVNFSTPQLRLQACEAEVALNSLTALGLYLGVRRITRAPDGSLSFDGKGAVVDAVIEMLRFDQSLLFDQMAMAGRLDARLMTRTARMIAGFHRQAPVIDRADGAERVASVLAINVAGFSTSDVFAPSDVERLTARFDRARQGFAGLLDRRSQLGKVRRCHGDLHLRNICLLEGEPRLFDCIEFNPELATTDVLYDLAFLLMDLWHRGFADLANLTMNRYLDETEEEDGVPLLPFFMAMRAAVRAHVTATQVAEADERSEALAAEARAYFDLADHLLAEKPARLVVIGGLSGSGKSTLADHLAPYMGVPPGARILESDRIRKGLFDVPAETRLPQAAYAPDISTEVYRRLAQDAQALLASGVSVVADAVFDRPETRSAMALAAAQANVAFTGLWLEADPQLLGVRVRTREPGPSDATLEVLAMQLIRRPDVPDWRHLAADAPIDQLVEAALDGSPRLTQS
jgi:hypothetical protein